MGVTAQNRATMPAKLTNEIITAAIDGFESQKRKIDDQIAELRAMLPGSSAETTATQGAPTRKPRKFSAAARRRMKEAQQTRWAKIRGESEPSAAAATPEPSKPKRRISEEGMKRIIAATKKRWALKRAEAAKAKKTAPPRKKATVKKAALKVSPAKAAKRAPVKKTATKKTAPASTPSARDAAG